MGIINVDDIVPEMVLAADIMSHHGRLLLPKGSVITSDHIGILNTWGVTEADVEGYSEAEVRAVKLQKFTPAIVRYCEALASKRFELSDRGHEVMDELARQYILRTAQHISRDGGVSAPPDLPAGEKESPAGPVPSPLLQQQLGLERIFLDEIELVSLPNIFFQITETLNNPRSSAVHVADVISKDVAISLKILKLVNSSFYGFSQKIDTLPRAVVLIGSNQLTTIALGISVMKVFDTIPSELIDMESFWRHSLACGMVSRFIAGKLDNMNEERFFVAGLLHDIGRLIMLKKYPQITKDLLDSARKDTQPLPVKEMEFWQTDHQSIAGHMLKQWNFPATLELAIRFHHSPLEAPSVLEPGIIHLADIIVHSQQFGESGNPYVPSLVPAVWQTMNLSKNVLTQVLTQVESQLDGLMEVFFH